VFFLASPFFSPDILDYFLEWLFLDFGLCFLLSGILIAFIITVFPVLFEALPFNLGQKVPL
jgi:hypothetical protein